MDQNPTPPVQIRVMEPGDMEAFIGGRSAFGKQALPADAPVSEFMSQLRRAQALIRQRNGNPDAVTDGRFVVILDEVALLARDPGNTELRDLLRQVREQGPSVDVSILAPSPQAPRPAQDATGAKRWRNELAELLTMTPVSELVSRLDELGWLEEYARLIGVTEETVDSWRDGGEAGTQAHVRLARFVATCVTIEQLGVSNVVAWFRTPLRPPCPHTPLDLARADIGLEMAYAAGEHSAEEVLEEFDELCRTRE